MNNAVMLGILWHLVGAASAACFYAPFKKVRRWSWETMWSIGGLMSWLILPWAVSYVLLPDFWRYYSSFDLSTLLPVFLFGAMWGIGNVNYGLTMRYLGMSMGIGIAIGITLVVGTLMTPLLQGRFVALFSSAGGQLTLLGVAIALLGVVIVSWAGVLKERAMGIRAEEFNLRKGLLLAVMCGIFSAGMSFAMDAAKPMHQAAADLGIDPLYVALPSYVVIMGAGHWLTWPTVLSVWRSRRICRSRPISRWPNRCWWPTYCSRYSAVPCGICNSSSMPGATPTFPSSMTLSVGCCT
ncbi:L-rhamnose-H(+) transport protein [Serratia quinivorans]|nr:L-rhamnose-H(+) transport protein [Serratia quinivorans]VEI68513.1 L-rhamnose-H(+) transport protein [Serratia quinivorans]